MIPPIFIVLVLFGALLGWILFAKYVNTSTKTSYSDPLGLTRCNPISNFDPEAVSDFSSPTCSNAEILDLQQEIQNLSQEQYNQYYLKLLITTVEGEVELYVSSTFASLNSGLIPFVSTSPPPWTQNSVLAQVPPNEDSLSVTASILYIESGVGNPPSDFSYVDVGDNDFLS